MSTITPTTDGQLTLDEETLWRKIEERSFCTLATTAPGGTPHVAGVLYAVADRTLYVSTLRPSRKARNIAAASAPGVPAAVSVCILVRRLPVGPPSSIQFRGRAEILDVDDPALVPHLGTKPFRAITSHGELDLPGSCFLRIEPGDRFVIYGLGLPLRRLIRDPLHAGGAVDVGQLASSRSSSSPQPSSEMTSASASARAWAARMRRGIIVAATTSAATSTPTLRAKPRVMAST